MPYEYIDHEADVGIKGIGDTLEEAFQEGAKAMYNIMVDLDKVEQTEQVEISCEAPAIDSLFVEWLNTLLSKDMFFSKFEVKIENLKLTGNAFGEKINPEKHEIKTEVKAATYSGLKYEEKQGKHYIQCVVDV